MGRSLTQRGREGTWFPHILSLPGRVWGAASRKKQRIMSTQTEHERASLPGWLPLALVGGLVVVAALVAIVITGGLSGQTTPAAAPAPALEAPAAGDAALSHGGLNPDGPPVTQISLAEARTHFEAGTAIFIDVRAGTAFTAGHIPGALTITSRELEQRIEQVTPDMVIIAYGDATRPESGMRGAQIFMELGYPTVIALEGGFQAWRDAGYPVER
jgi:rhodanese-related sulfurtransferase